LYQNLDKSFHKQAGKELGKKSLERLRYFWLDGLAATISENFYANFLVVFAIAYGASSRQIGIMTALANLCGALRWVDN
jgi:hypothetical protein